MVLKRCFQIIVIVMINTYCTCIIKLCKQSLNAKVTVLMSLFKHLKARVSNIWHVGQNQAQYGLDDFAKYNAKVKL